MERYRGRRRAGRGPFWVPALILVTLSGCDGDAPLLFSDPVRVVIESAPEGEASVGEVLGEPILIRVLDRHNRGVPGVEVSLAPGTPSARLTEPRLRTDGQGRAVVQGWVLGREPGIQRLEVSVAGVRGAFVEIRARAGPPGSLSFAGPRPEGARVGALLEQLPGVVVRDRFGHPVPGARVRLEVTAGGSLAESEIVTDSTGRAELPAWRLGTATGVHTLRAETEGPTVHRLHVEVVAGAPAEGEWSGVDAARVDPGLGVPGDPKLVVRDAFGNPVPGHPVAFEVLGGGGRLDGPDDVTGPDGRASPGRWTLGMEPGPQRLLGKAEGLDEAILEITASGPDDPPDGFHYRIAGLHINQGNQSFEGEVPLIAGRPGLMRVWVAASRTAGPVPEVRARIRLRDVLLADTLLPSPALSSPPLDVAWDATSPSWDLPLPGEWIGPDLRVDLEIDPDRRQGVHSRRLNEAADLNFEVVQIDTFRIRFVPLRDGASGLEGQVSPENVHHFMSAARRMLPIAHDRVSVGPPVSLDLIDASGTVRVALPELRAVWALSAFRDHYLHGIFPAELPRRFLGVAYRPADPAFPAPIGISFDRLPQAANTVAHELGHNLGLMHAPCGEPPGVDPTYPYADGGLGFPGYDPSQRRLVPVDGFRDLMGYCHPRWPSDHTFEAMLRWRLVAPHGAPSLAQTPSKVPSRPGLLVWGRTGSEGSYLEPALPVEAVPLLPGGAGSHYLRAIDSDGREVFAFAFEPDGVPHAPDPMEAHFAFIIPLDPREVNSITALELSSPSGRAVRRDSLTSEGVTAPPGSAVRYTSTFGGPDVLEWDTALLPLLILRDSTNGEIRGIHRSGRVELDVRRGALEMSFSDGIRGWQMEGGRLRPSF